MLKVSLFMVSDRRDYDRIQIGIEGVLFKNGEELSFKVYDICEYGIGMIVPKNLSGGIKVDDLLTIEFFDKYEVGKHLHSDVVVCKAKVRHVDVNDDNRLIGCYIYDQSYIDYVNRRKFVDYYNRCM